jgi:NAD(P)-dependent dehydrogenase (short-subunit alcohol dehydrogenase family)
MRVAVITGGMGGLGDSISAKMHAAGYRVVVTHSPGNTKAKEWISEHKASGREFSAYPVDVADFDSCKECVARIAKEVGPVDILVNNAGITRDTTFKKMSKGDWDCRHPDFVIIAAVLDYFEGFSDLFRHLKEGLLLARLSERNQTSAHVVGDLAQARVELATICEPSPPRFARCCWTPICLATHRRPGTGLL